MLNNLTTRIKLAWRYTEAAAPITEIEECAAFIILPIAEQAGAHNNIRVAIAVYVAGGT